MTSWGKTAISSFKSRLKTDFYLKEYPHFICAAFSWSTLFWEELHRESWLIIIIIIITLVHVCENVCVFEHEHTWNSGVHPIDQTSDHPTFSLWSSDCNICECSTNTFWGPCVRHASVLTGGTGGKRCVSDSSEEVNSTEERSLVSVALRRPTSRSGRSRGGEQTHFSAAHKLWNEMNSEVSPCSEQRSRRACLYPYPPSKCHREFGVFEWAQWFRDWAGNRNKDAKRKAVYHLHSVLRPTSFFSFIFVLWLTESVKGLIR